MAMGEESLEDQQDSIIFFNVIKILHVWWEWRSDVDVTVSKTTIQYLL